MVGRPAHVGRLSLFRKVLGAMEAMRGRWTRELTGDEIKKVLNARSLEIAESDKMGLEFFASQTYLAIIRTSGLGGDAYNVHGGWKYPNFIAFLQDWTEIKSIADRVSRWGEHSETKTDR